MKILLASSSSGSRGGGEIFLRYLGQGLAARGHELIFWCAEHPRMDELAGSLASIGKVARSQYRNFYDHKTRILATCFNNGTSRKLAAEWSRLRPDVIHVNKQNLEDGLDMLRAAGSLAIPSVCTIHITQTAKYLGAKLGGLRDALSRRCLNSFRGPYVAVQETRRDELAAFLGNGHATHSIFNGVPMEANGAEKDLRKAKRDELHIADGELLVVGVGRMEAQKRPLLFLEVAEGIQKRVPQARFLWVGGGSLVSQWDHLVTERGLSQFVRRLEWQSDVKPFLFAADLFLHVAAYEGLPFALIEAMSAGLPCAVPEDMAREVSVFDGENLLFIEDVSKLAGIMTQPAELQAKGQRARRLCQEHFSIEKMSQEYEALYASLSTKRRNS